MTFVQKLAAILSAISWRQPSVTAKLHERDLWFRQMTEYIREVFFLCNPGMTRTFYVSPGYEDIWGRSCDSLYANPTSFIEGIHVDDRERVLQTMAPHGTMIPFDVEGRIAHAEDGTVRWVRGRGIPIRNESGELYRFAGIIEDITERKTAFDVIARQAQALEDSTRRLSLLGEMTGLLQTAVKVEEAAAIVGGYMGPVHLG